MLSIVLVRWLLVRMHLIRRCLILWAWPSQVNPGRGQRPLHVLSVKMEEPHGGLERGHLAQAATLTHSEKTNTLNLLFKRN